MSVRQKGGKDDFFKPRGTNTEEAATSKEETAIGEILKGQRELLSNMKEMKEEMGSLKGAVNKMEGRLHLIEQKMHTLDLQVVSQATEMRQLGATVRQLEKTVEYHADFVPAAANNILALESKVERLENLRRGCGVRILGMPPLQADTNLKEVVKSLIHDLLPTPGDTMEEVVKRVRRLPSTRKGTAMKDGGGTVLLTVDSIERREDILRVAAQRKVVHCMDCRVLLFPDVAPETQEKRSKMAEIRKEIVSLGHGATLWHPARLKAEVAGKRYTFLKVAEAEEFVRNLKSGMGTVPAGDTD